MKKLFLLLLLPAAVWAVDHQLTAPIGLGDLNSFNQRQLEAARSRALIEERVRYEAASARDSAIATAQRARDEAASRKALAARERENRARQAADWRVVGGVTNNLLAPGWRLIYGKVLETQPDGLRVSLEHDETVLLANYGLQVADQTTVAAYAQETGLHSYLTVLGARATIKKYDCGRACEPPAGWREKELARLDAERAEVAAQEKAEADTLEAARRKFRAEQSANTARIVAYQNQQASNGMPSF